LNVVNRQRRTERGLLPDPTSIHKKQSDVLRVSK
jgi:hypothetical protein